jgi:hypothetical protein
MPTLDQVLAVVAETRTKYQSKVLEARKDGKDVLETSRLVSVSALVVQLSCAHLSSDCASGLAYSWLG